uniref:Uncharacterized protein n=1 Tax=Globodera rostochiensis TaxID=31243 RepID=A0A914HDB4_GLORO
MPAEVPLLSILALSRQRANWRAGKPGRPLPRRNANKRRVSDALNLGFKQVGPEMPPMFWTCWRTLASDAR